MHCLRTRSAARIGAASLLSLLIGAASLAAPAAADAPSRLRAGDKVQVTVYNHPEFSGASTVTDAGNVFVPMAGEIDARGVDARGFAARVARRMAAYIPHAAVDVTVVSSDPSILVDGGPVAVLPYTPGETLANAIAQLEAPPAQYAGQSGDSPSQASGRNLRHGRIDLRRVGVVRDGVRLGTFDAVALGENGLPGVVLHLGDTIVLTDKPVRVVVQGEVREPGTAYLDANEALTDALTQVGGTLTTATSHALLTREAAVRTVALGSEVFAAPARDGDALFVPRAPHVGVVGAVDKPGDVSLPGDASLLSAIYNAGGPQKNADLKDVVIVHEGRRQTFDVVAAVHGKGATPVLADGDTVLVPVGHRFDYATFWQAVGSLGSVLYVLK